MYGSILLYGCTTWMPTKWMEKKLKGNYIRMLYVVMNKSCENKTASITKVIQVKQTGHRGQCWMHNVLPWTPTHGHTNVGQPAKNYIHHLCADIGCSLEDLPAAIDNKDDWEREREREERERERERVMEICTISVTWWCLVWFGFMTYQLL